MFIAVIAPLAVVIALTLGALAAGRWDHRHHTDLDPTCDACIDNRVGAPGNRNTR